MVEQNVLSVEVPTVEAPAYTLLVFNPTVSFKWHHSSYGLSMNKKNVKEKRNRLVEVMNNITGNFLHPLTVNVCIKRVFQGRGWCIIGFEVGKLFF